jgi:kynurenine formamidase
MPTSERLIDVSHTVEHGMITYKGFLAPVICDWLSREASRAKYAAGTEFQIGKIEMIANTGTYVDSPFHRYENGKDLSELPLASTAWQPGHVRCTPCSWEAKSRSSSICGAWPRFRQRAAASLPCR